MTEFHRNDPIRRDFTVTFETRTKQSTPHHAILLIDSNLIPGYYNYTINMNIHLMS